MTKYYCPDCGRFLLASDAPPGYSIRVPRCLHCKNGKLLRTAPAVTDLTIPPARATAASGTR